MFLQAVATTGTSYTDFIILTCFWLLPPILIIIFHKKIIKGIKKLIKYIKDI